MSDSPLKDKLTKTKVGYRLYEQERAIQELTDWACELMDDQGLKVRHLACRLYWSDDRVARALDGRGRMTIREWSDIFNALGRSLHFSHGKIK